MAITHLKNFGAVGTKGWKSKQKQTLKQMEDYFATN